MPSMEDISHNGAPGEGDVPYVDVLIIGAGPAGASLACFLASHGMFRYQNRLKSLYTHLNQVLKGLWWQRLPELQIRLGHISRTWQL
jgi:cation diffusion facilitator CzcD-associated flavoprotein CzcO